MFIKCYSYLFIKFSNNKKYNKTTQIDDFYSIHILLSFIFYCFMSEVNIMFHSEFLTFFIDNFLFISAFFLKNLTWNYTSSIMYVCIFNRTMTPDQGNLWSLPDFLDDAVQFIRFFFRLIISNFSQTGGNNMYF